MSEVAPSVVIWGWARPIAFVLLALVGIAVGALNLRAGYVSSVESERKKIVAWTPIERGKSPSRTPQPPTLSHIPARFAGKRANSATPQ